MFDPVRPGTPVAGLTATLRQPAVEATTELQITAHADC